MSASRHTLTPRDTARGQLALAWQRRTAALRKIAGAPTPLRQGFRPLHIEDEPAPWDIDALIERIEAQIADDATRGGSAFSR